MKVVVIVVMAILLVSMVSAKGANDLHNNCEEIFTQCLYGCGSLDGGLPDGPCFQHCVDTEEFKKCRGS